MGAYKARSYWRPKYSLGRRIGANYRNTIINRGVGSSAVGYDVVSGSSVPSTVRSQDRIYDASFAAAIRADGTGTTSLTPNIGQGANQFARTGNQIELRWIDVCFTLSRESTQMSASSITNFFNTVRFMLVLDRVTAGASPALSTYKQNNLDPIHSPWDSDFVPGAFVVLLDTIHSFDASRTTCSFRKRIALRNITTTFLDNVGGVAGALNNHLFFLFQGMYDDAPGVGLQNRIQAQVSFCICFSE